MTKQPEKVDTTDADLNPQITEVQIGIKKLRTIKIYPLSFGDELETTDLITEALQAFYVKDQQEDAVFVGFILNLIKKNLSKILGMATDEDGEKLLREISNVQAVEIAKIIYETNFDSPLKNLKSLTEKVKSILPSGGQSQELSKNTEDTD